MKEDKVIALCFDKNFLLGYKALISSIFAHTRNFNYPIVILDLGLGKEDKEYCKSIYNNLTFRQVKKSNYTYRPKTKRKRLMNTYYKLDMFRLAIDYNVLIYIDVDIIFTKSIRKLINYKPSKTLSIVNLIIKREKVDEYNTGLYILNDIKNEKHYSNMINIMRSMEKAGLSDQTVVTKAINTGLLEYELIPQKWNVMKCQITRDNVKDYNSIHFYGSKPWDKRRNPEYKELDKIWWKYANRNINTKKIK